MTEQKKRLTDDTRIGPFTWTLFLVSSFILVCTLYFNKQLEAQEQAEFERIYHYSYEIPPGEKFLLPNMFFINEQMRQKNSCLGFHLPEGDYELELHSAQPKRTLRENDFSPVGEARPIEIYEKQTVMSAISLFGINTEDEKHLQTAFALAVKNLNSETRTARVHDRCWRRMKQEMEGH